MNQRLKKYKMWISIMVAALLLSGCSGKEELPQLAGEESQATGVYYQIHETVLPDPDEELLLLLSEEGDVRELDLLYEQGTLYRVAQTWDMIDGILQTEGYYLQKLEAPYSSWEMVRVPATCWDKTLTHDGGQYSLQEVLQDADGRILCRVAHYTEDLEEEQYLGYYGQDGIGELLGLLPSGELQWYVTSKGELYGYSVLSGGDWTFVDAEFQAVREQSVNGIIYGLYEMPDTGEVYWYGENTDGYGCWNIENGSPLYQGIQQISFLEDAALTPGKKAFFADLNGIWEYSTDNPKGVQIIDFFDRNYILEEIISITATGEDTLALLVRMDGEHMLLQIEKTNELPSTKKQIVLALPMEDITSVEDFIVQFNRRSNVYEVVPMYPEKGQEGLAFGDKIQMELAAGRGPDMFMNGMISIDSLAQNGYLQNLDGLLEEEDYWPVALECGKVDGKLYGIPYEAYLHAASYSESLTGGREHWTLEEFMEAVRLSDAEIVQQGFGGMDIVIYYGLLDNSNKEFIDWEQGISHLNEEAFLEFLQFAYEYMDRGEIAAEDFAEAMQDGRIAAESGPYELVYLNYIKECFQGKDSNIGFPRAEGNGIYVTANMMFVNSNSKVTEGAKEFLKFITSKEMQYRYAEKHISGYFPIHMEAMERQIELKEQEEESKYLAVMNGIEFQRMGLTEERKEVFYFLMENSQPAVWKADPILDIFSEELEPFFAGECTAKEATDKLHSRVQVYLDENY